MVAGRSIPILQATWTSSGAAFWGWDKGQSVRSEKLRRVASPILGSRWATHEADLDSIEVRLPLHDQLHVPALIAEPRTAVELLYSRYPKRTWSASVHWLHAATSLVVDAAMLGLVLPMLKTSGLHWETRWELAGNYSFEQLLARLCEIMPPVIAASETVEARKIVGVLADSACRLALKASSWKPFLPLSLGASVVTMRRVISALEADGGLVDVEINSDNRTLASISAAMSEVRSVAEGAVRLTSRARLTPGGRGEPWVLLFDVSSLDDPMVSVSWGDVWDGTQKSYNLVQGSSIAPVKRYLSDLAARLARLVPGLEQLTEESPSGELELELEDVELLLTHGFELCHRSGVSLLVPKGLFQRRLRFTAVASTFQENHVSGDLGSGLVDVNWGLALGDEPLTDRELQTLAESKSGLVEFREEWVLLDAVQRRFALEELESRRTNSRILRAPDLMRILAEDVAENGFGDKSLLVAKKSTDSGDSWLPNLLAGLPDNQLEEVKEPAGFVGELRPYQRRALGWMQFLASLGLGGCLADDMGLGKTPTTVAHIVSRDAAEPTFVVCPLSVIHNWESEIARFAPNLRVLVVHGPDRPKSAHFLEVAVTYNVIISTYLTAARDIETLRQIKWDLVICDEAQVIKNYQTNAAQVVRDLTARQTVALTGTPIENRLMELWAILDAVNPGVLGRATWFRDNFATPIEKDNDKSALEGMRSLTGAFVLRREKTDNALVPDLPSKVEQVAWATLTREQAGLYRAVLDDFLSDVDVQEGMKRRGLVLSTLTRLKQICNHPAHFLNDGSILDGRSGKLTRFDELVGDLIDAGEQALVFTQYKAMGDLLQTHLAENFDLQPDFLHGGVSRSKRQEMIHSFQGKKGVPIQIVSLKAGGTGLNLTAASRVIHYDRWWNPAVEDQATDRAWRIGQVRTVFVHKMVCQGTLEERIDSLLIGKKKLADQAVGTGEKWFTEMDTDQLQELLELDESSVFDL